MLLSEAPADLDAGSELRLKARDGQAKKSSESSDARNLYCPETEAMTLEASFDSGDEAIALCARQSGGEILRNAWVQVQRGKGLSIRLTPGSKQEPLCPKLGGVRQVLLDLQLELVAVWIELADAERNLTEHLASCLGR